MATVLFAVLVVLTADVLWFWLQDRRRRWPCQQRFRDVIVPPPSGGGLDLPLQHQSWPFNRAAAMSDLYGPGALQEGNKPRPAGRIARDIIERERTLDRLPWLRKGRILDERA